MSLTDFPTLVDTFPTVDDSAGDQLNTLTKEHDFLHNKLAQAIIALELMFQGALIDVRTFGAIGNGTANDTTAIVEAMASASPGDTLYFPRGSYKTDPIVMSKCLHFVGDGRFSSWLSSRNAGQTTPLVDMSLTIDSGLGVRDNYGPSFRNMGIDLSVASGAIGIKTGGASSGWAVIDDFYIQGGALAIDQRMPNTIINDGVMADSGKFIKIYDTGTEVVLRDLVMQRVSAGTTSKAIEMISTHGGINGAIFIQNVRVNVNAVAGVTLAAGLWVEAPSEASIPVFAEQLIIDNCSGAALVLIRVGDGSYANCWFNGARGTSNGAVSIFGGIFNKFANSTFFGGASGGCSYDFTGGRPAQVSSVGNMLQTGNPTYRFSATAADWPVGMVAKDILANPEVIICNEAVGFKIATGTRIVGSTGAPALVNAWANAGGGYEVAQFRKEGQTITLAGTVASGTAALMFTLPLGYRPSSTQQFIVVGPAGAPVYVQVVNNGNVQVPSIPAALSLDGINFTVGG